MYLAQAETYRKKLSDDVSSVIKCTDDLASQTLDDDEDDDDDDDMPELIPGGEDSDDESDDEGEDDPDVNDGKEEEDEKVSTILLTHTMNLNYLSHEFAFCVKGARPARSWEWLNC